jgi:hypothetical protein
MTIKYLGKFDWTKEDENTLIRALRKHHFHYDKILKELKTKSLGQVKHFIAKQKKLGNKKILKLIKYQNTNECWSDEENKRLDEALRLYGLNFIKWQNIWEVVRSKSIK